MKLPFDPSDPFPLCQVNSYSYSEAKEHAALVDQWLGFKIASVEQKLNFELHGNQLWNHLDPQAFQTPYIEFRTIMDLVKPEPGSTVVDLGCGYARLGHIIGRHYGGHNSRHYEKVQFLGFEVSDLRVIEAQRILAPFKYSNVEILQQDLCAPGFQLPGAQTFFIYDYGDNHSIQKTLSDLRVIAKNKKITVVARGRSSRHFIHLDHAWLASINPAEHYGTFSIYRS